MELLRFTDSDGREWEVWEVGTRPTLADRPLPSPAPIRGPDRWLCFESGTERRRLIGYPTRWHTLTPRELDALCRTATPSRVVPTIAPHGQPHAQTQSQPPRPDLDAR